MPESVDVRRVGAVPPALAATRAALHTLTTNVLTPVRYRAARRIALEATPGGFGTFAFGDDERVRVDGTDLVIEQAGHEKRAPLTTIGAAAELVLGQPTPDMQWTRDLTLHDTPDEAPAATQLHVDEAASRFLGEWFGFAFTVLRALRDDPASTDPSDPQLWPEHFDAAIEVLAGNRRASYGFSPGDDSHVDPYAYVSVWYPDSDEIGGLSDKQLWNSSTFPGAVLPLATIRAAGDQFTATLDWMRSRRDVLAG